MDESNKEILAKIEQGILNTMNSEHYKSFLKVQSQFYNYSFNNQMLIYLQRPDATRVAGYKAWEKFERHVMKGEKGIGILAPNPYKYEKLVDKIDSKNNKPIRDEHGEIVQTKEMVTGLSFRKVSVFDIKQTDGKELPSICDELQGNSINAESIIKAIKQVSEVHIIEKVIKDGAKGYYSRLENLIAINKDMSLDQTAKTLIHEYAHSQLHNTEAAALLDRATKEVQAESVAYIASNHFGVDTSEYSFDYLANWSSGKDLKELKNSFDTIQKTANKIIEGIENVLTKELELQNKESVIKPSVVQTEECIKTKIIEQYSKEYPAIKHISENTAKIIDNLNQQKGHAFTIKEIKQAYKDAGKKIEISNDKSDMNDFKLLKEVSDDLKQAQLTDKQIKAHDKSMQSQINKSKSLEMIQ